MLDRSHRRFEFLFAKAFVRRTQMLNQKPERNLLGDLQRALDLVHGLDATGAIRGSDVERRSSGASPLIVGEKRRVHGVQRNAAAAKPLGNLLDVGFAVGVVEMLARCKNLDRLHTGARESVEDARMQALLNK